MNSNTLSLNFYGVSVALSSDCPGVIQKLSKDFSYFISLSTVSRDLTIEIYQSDPPYGEIEGLISKGQSVNCISYERHHTKYFDYYGTALASWSQERMSGKVYSTDVNRLHEISYLMILSKVGKIHDSRGMHKVHAFGVGSLKKDLICMLPMKGGKTTLFLELLKDTTLEIISDDTPLIDRRGNIYSFPLRVGVESEESLPEGDRSELYSIDRMEYGKKILAPLSYFKNHVSKDLQRYPVLVAGYRSRMKRPVLKKVSKLTMMKELYRHMIVGVGLPMVVEFFVENTIADWLKLFYIGISRNVAAVRLIGQSDCYHLYLCDDPAENAELIKRELL